MHPDGDTRAVVEVVLARDLGLGVGAGPPQGAVAPQVGDLPAG